MGEAGKVLVVILLHHVDNKRGENQNQEPDVERRDEFLSVGVDHSAEELPGAAPPVHPDHPQDLEEPEPPEGRGSVDPATQAREHNQRGTEAKYSQDRGLNI